MQLFNVIWNADHTVVNLYMFKAYTLQVIHLMYVTL